MSALEQDNESWKKEGKIDGRGILTERMIGKFTKLFLHCNTIKLMLAISRK